MAGPDRALRLLVLSQFLDAIGFTLGLPTLPETWAGAGVSVREQAQATAFASVLGVASAVGLGRVSDTAGRLPALRAAALCTLAGSVVFASATTPTLLLAGRVIPGLAKGQVAVAQAMATDLSAGTARSAAAGVAWLAIARSVAFIVGPAVGAHVPDVHRWCAACAFANVLLVGLLLRGGGGGSGGTRRDPKPATARDDALPAKKSPILGVYVAWVLYCVARGIYESLAPTLMRSRFGWSAATMGCLFSAAGVVSTLSNALVLRYGARGGAAAAVHGACLLAWGTASDGWVFLAGVAGISATNAIVQAGVRARMSAGAPRHLVGTTLGVGAAIDVVGRGMLGPIVGAEALNVGAVGPLAAALCGAAAVALLRPDRRGREKSKRE